MPAFSTLVWAAVGVLIGVLIWKFGIGMVRTLGSPQPAPPPPGEMRKVTVRYRCGVCGLEIKTLIAPDEDPPPPRHCLEDMDVIAPRFE